jgi:hypothetical protein
VPSLKRTAAAVFAAAAISAFGASPAAAAGVPSAMVPTCGGCHHHHHHHHHHLHCWESWRCDPYGGIDPYWWGGDCGCDSFGWDAGWWGGFGDFGLGGGGFGFNHGLFL